MADNAKILGQYLARDAAYNATAVITLTNWLAEAKNAFLYRVPQLTQTISSATPKAAVYPIRTIVSSMTVCNTDAATTYNVVLLSLADLETANITFSDKQYIMNARPISANTTEVIGLGMTLSAGDGIVVWTASDSKVSFNLFGFEIS